MEYSRHTDNEGVFMSVNLTIVDDSYKIKIGAEVYKVEYPSFEEAEEIAEQMGGLEGDNKKAIKVMKEWLIKLGLDEKFFSIKSIKAKHIMQIWRDLNSVK